MFYKLITKTALVILASLSCAIFATAQSPAQQVIDQRQARMEADRAKAIDRATKDMLERNKREIKETKPSPYRDSAYYDKKMTDSQKKMLAPLAEDRARFAEFLKQNKTGMVKLLPKGEHDFDYTISANEDPEMVLPIPGGGAYYSFSKKNHAFGPWSEISLQEKLLVAGFASETLGMIVSLGDVPIESVGLSTGGVDYLSSYAPPTLYEQAQTERKRQLMGFKANGFAYRALVPVIPNATYVMRSISYEKRGRISPYAPNGYVPHPFEYEGADVLIAFRIVRQAEDGSVTLLWKWLKKYHTPKIKHRS